MTRRVAAAKLGTQEINPVPGRFINSAAAGVTQAGNPGEAPGLPA